MILFFNNEFITLSEGVYTSYGAGLRKKKKHIYKIDKLLSVPWKIKTFLYVKKNKNKYRIENTVIKSVSRYGSIRVL